MTENCGSLGGRNRVIPRDLMFQALANPTRRAMVERLSRGPASVSELAKPFAMSLPAVVQHLQVLEQSGLVRSQKQGRVRTCAINTEALGEAEQWLNECRDEIEQAIDRLMQITYNKEGFQCGNCVPAVPIT